MMYNVGWTFPFNVTSVTGLGYSTPRDTYECIGFAKVESAARRIQYWEKKLNSSNKKNKKELRKKIAKIRRASNGYVKNAPEDFI